MRRKLFVKSGLSSNLLPIYARTKNVARAFDRWKFFADRHGSESCVHSRGFVLRTALDGADCGEVHRKGGGSEHRSPRASRGWFESENSSESRESWIARHGRANRIRR